MSVSSTQCNILLRRVVGHRIASFVRFSITHFLLVLGYTHHHYLLRYPDTLASIRSTIRTNDKIAMIRLRAGGANHPTIHPHRAKGWNEGGGGWGGGVGLMMMIHKSWNILRMTKESLLNDITHSLYVCWKDSSCIFVSLFAIVSIC